MEHLPVPRHFSYCPVWRIKYFYSIRLVPVINFYFLQPSAIMLPYGYSWLILVNIACRLDQDEFTGVIFVVKINLTLRKMLVVVKLLKFAVIIKKPCADGPAV